ncbi:hypothetical protein BpHYR1_048194 [Brachionus plicatilis]|uniref:Uncharacterized protein n=1 Tax=Brachionus plicatilis TaxID=10195 RepID=A0A3M7PD90_BRAPC|nr:hypothetical protein BpHYR1_048194 [Brachionus plicatilis]
MQKEKINKKKV